MKFDLFQFSDVQLNHIAHQPTFIHNLFAKKGLKTGSNIYT